MPLIVNNSRWTSKWIDSILNWTSRAGVYFLGFVCESGIRKYPKIPWITRTSFPLSPWGGGMLRRCTRCCCHLHWTSSPSMCPGIRSCSMDSLGRHDQDLCPLGMRELDGIGCFFSIALAPCFKTLHDSIYWEDRLSSSSVAFIWPIDVWTHDLWYSHVLAH